MRYATTITLLTWNALCLSLVGLAWGFGLIQGVFRHDASHITWVIAGLMALVLVQTTYQTFQLDRLRGTQPPEKLAGMTSLVMFMKSEIFIILGICGTLLGIMMVTGSSAVTDTSPEALAARIAASNAGLHSGVGASLVGMTCKLWSETIVFIKSSRLRQLGWL